MGLPIWREPTVAETAVKNDKPAHARSAIRRLHRVRGNPYSASSYRLSSGITSQTGDAITSPHRSLLFEVIRRPHRRISPPTEDSSSDSDMDIDAIAHAADLARLEASNRRRFDGRALLRDALSYEHAGRRMRERREASHIMPPPLPPVPESRDYARRPPWEHSMERRLDDLARRRGNRLPSPNFSLQPIPPYTPGSGDASSRSSPHSQAITPPLGSAALTPGFPPAHRWNNQPREPLQGPLAQPPSYAGADAPRLRSTQEDLDIDDLPPLRRLRRVVDGPLPTATSRPLSQLQPPQQLVDGLGDRDRSISPAPADDPWETLLTTMTPDARLPSTHSSFTSASASASFTSNSGSTSTSLATAPTSSSAMDPFPVCDLLETDSEGSMTEVDDDDDEYGDYPRNGFGSSYFENHSDRQRPRYLPLTAPRENNQRLRIPSTTERREVEAMFRDEMGRDGLMAPDDWWVAEGLMPPSGRSYEN